MIVVSYITKEAPYKLASHSMQILRDSEGVKKDTYLVKLLATSINFVQAVNRES